MIPHGPERLPRALEFLVPLTTRKGRRQVTVDVGVSGTVHLGADGVEALNGIVYGWGRSQDGRGQ